MWLGAAALNDVIIAACMIWYLQRARTGIRQTETLITVGATANRFFLRSISQSPPTREWPGP